MIVFVDYEHADGRRTDWGEKLLAARTWITYRLEDLSGQPCMLVRYDRISAELLDRLGATAVFISGNATDPSRYDPASLEPLTEIITSGRWPTFGFCGGFQFMATALGAALTPIVVDPEWATSDPVAVDSVGGESAATESVGGGSAATGSAATGQLGSFPDGSAAEIGYGPIQLIAEHPLLEGVAADPIVRHAHALEVPVPPPGFVVLASTPITRVQMAVDDERRLVGTQFHPEYYSDERPAGRIMIENFLRWSGVTAG